MRSGAAGHGEGGIARHMPGFSETIASIAAGELDAHTAISRQWSRARALEADLQAFACLPDVEPVAGIGPLAGIAVGVKDLIDTADLPTAYGTTIFRAHRPAADAAVVARLRALGASVLGKTVTTEFAYRQPGPTRNPWTLRHTPGGSSSGSAAAVAAGIVPLALGTQTMGSVIRPAAFCGVIGYKPTFGTLPREGVHPLCGALDHVGLFARSVADVAAALGYLAPTIGQAALRPPFRFAALAMTDDTIQPAQRQATEMAWRVIAAAGHTVEPLVLPPAFDAVPGLIETLVGFEAARHFGALVDRHGEAVGPAIRALVQQGRTIGEANYWAALARQSDLRDAFAATVQGFDAILTIPASGEAPEGLGFTGDPRFCAPWSLVGAPALTFPIGFGPSGLPLGLQLVGRYGGDAALLTTAAAVADLFPPVEVAPCGG